MQQHIPKLHFKLKPYNHQHYNIIKLLMMDHKNQVLKNSLLNIDHYLEYHQIYFILLIN